MNARGIPTAAYQVLHLLPYLGGGGVPTLARGTYLGQGVPTLAWGYLSWPGVTCLGRRGGTYLGWGVPTLAGGTYPRIPPLSGPGQGIPLQVWTDRYL